MKVSICIPTYNQVQYLRLAVESALAQTFQDLEIVISDNHCTDGTREYLDSVQDSRVRVVRPPRHLSVNGNFEFCFANARGQYISPLCSDDLIAPEYADTMAAIMDAHRDVAFAYSAIAWIDELGRQIGTERHVGGSFHHTGRAEMRRFLKGAGCNFPTVMIRRDLYESVGGYSKGSSVQNAVSVGDWDLELRLLQVGDIYYHDAVLGYFRVWSTPEREDRFFGFVQECCEVYGTRVAQIVRTWPELAEAADDARRRRAAAFAEGLGRYVESNRFEEGAHLVLRLADTPSVRRMLGLHRRGLTPVVDVKNDLLRRLRFAVKGFLHWQRARSAAAR